jgi:hypothetical protein
MLPALSVTVVVEVTVPSLSLVVTVVVVVPSLSILTFVVIFLPSLTVVVVLVLVAPATAKLTRATRTTATTRLAVRIFFRLRVRASAGNRDDRRWMSTL